MRELEITKDNIGQVKEFFEMYSSENTKDHVLAKEEKERTAEFLLTHPVSRRKIITDAFNQMGFPCFSPLGAFYIFPCIKSSGMTSEEFCERLLKEEKVAPYAKISPF